jgi:hypothetical protein
MTHQDCLKSWLEVKGGSGKCDLCKCKFHFAPKYAEDAPENLSTVEVITGISLRAISKWLPYFLRILLVAFVWLGILPLVTAYVYQGWMHRPASIEARLKWDLLPGDLVNGAILTITIILSFLSLMSLGDFFRFNWQRDLLGDGDGDQHENVEKVNAENVDSDVTIAPVQVGDDRECLYYDDSARSLSEKFDAEKHIIEKMINDSNKSVMDGGQLFHKYEDDSRDESVIFEDGMPNMGEMKMRLASGEENDDMGHEDNDFLGGDDHILPGGGVAALRRQRHRQMLRELNNQEPDAGIANAEAENNDANNEHDAESDEEDEDQLFERMMRLQERGADEEPEPENRNRVEPDMQGNRRFNPEMDPLDMPIDDAAMVRRYHVIIYTHKRTRINILTLQL